MVKNKYHNETEARERSYWLAIKCPVMGMPTPTGISVGSQDFSSIAFHRNSFSCKYCGQMHTWDGSDAFTVLPEGEYTNEEFKDENLILDGSSFNRCKMHECKIHISRGNFRLSNNTLSGCKFNFYGEAAAIKAILEQILSHPRD